MLRKYSLVVFLIGLVAIIVPSLIPPVAILNTEWSDQLGHMAGYAVLALVGGIAFRGARPLLLLVAGLLLLGAGIELVQVLLPGRVASGTDMLANVAGILLGAAVSILTNYALDRSPKRSS